MIKPTIGRVVWFQPAKPYQCPFLDQPHAAIVTYVHSDTLVNLAAFDANGNNYSAGSVLLLQDDAKRDDCGHFAEWMPYQIGQAKKHETQGNAIGEQTLKAVRGEAAEASIEKEIQQKGLTAPRLTPDMIDACIAIEDYHIFAGTTLTVCCLTLRNGFSVTGESAAASPENFDVEIGRKIARANARDKIWAMEGYLLKQNLSQLHGRPSHAPN